MIKKPSRNIFETNSKHSANASENTSASSKGQISVSAGRTIAEIKVDATSNDTSKKIIRDIHIEGNHDTVNNGNCNCSVS